eukprot:jgi/Mesen1/818/ME000111S10964
MSVQEYLDKHKLNARLGESVNAAVRAKADDPVIYIAKYLAKTNPSVITKIHARQIFDHGGNPAVEVDLHTSKGMYRASAPSGASSEMYEPRERGGDDEKSRLIEKGVAEAVAHVNGVIGPALVGKDPKEQGSIDRLMRAELDKSSIEAEVGASSAMMAVSLAVCKAGAAEKEVPLYQHIGDLAGNQKFVLPVPAFSAISSGPHSAGSEHAIQEIMILPVGARSFTEALRMGAETRHHLQAAMREKYGQGAGGTGGEGGLPPGLQSTKEGLGLVKEAIARAGLADSVKVSLGAAAPDSATDADSRDAGSHGSRGKTVAETVEIFRSFCSDYPVVSIEAPFEQEGSDEASRALTALNLCQVVGDRSLVGDHKKVAQAIERKTCNALFLKMDHVGTVSEALEAVKLARDAGWGVVAALGSGEAEDAWIADLAVGLAAGCIQSSAPCPAGELLAKFNQLLRVEEKLGERAEYAGRSILPNASPQ